MRLHRYAPKSLGAPRFKFRQTAGLFKYQRWLELFSSDFS